MKNLSIDPQKFDYLKVLHIVLFTTMMISCLLANANVRAATVTPSDYRLTAGNDNYASNSQAAGAFKMRPPRRLRGRHTQNFVDAILTLTSRVAILPRDDSFQFDRVSLRVLEID